MSVYSITNENFEAEVLQAKEPVLLDFYADWCGPCRMLSPIVHQLAEEAPQYRICKINVDEEPELARRFEVVSIPTLVVIKNGAVTERSTGVRPKAQILAMLEK